MRLRGIRAWPSAPQRAPFVRLFFEVHADHLAHPDHHLDGQQAVTDWFTTLCDVLADVCTGPQDTVTPTLVMAALRGLLFDLTLTGDRERTTLAVERLAHLLRT